MFFIAKNPFVKVLIPFIAGIVLQWYLQLPYIFSICIVAGCAFLGFLFSRLQAFQKLKYAWLQGMFMNLLIAGFAMMMVWARDICLHKNWFTNRYYSGMAVTAMIDEAPVEKEKSYKCNAKITSLITDNNKQLVTGNIIIYFKKDSVAAALQPGDELIFNHALQEIKNSGNPGGFDYKRYARLQAITHTVYLTGNDYEKLAGKKMNAIATFLHHARQYVLGTFKKYIHGKKEQGLAEALLIGYKGDLDKELLQSYTNVGVVHVIAVSGMHIALLYIILNFIFQPLLKRNSLKWLHPVLVLVIIWGFSLITGGAASIIRAAVMFTFITIGKAINRNASIYNTLAASAFALLCYNPYWLWDVGFQLSYAAVLSIVIFYKPLYQLLYIKNKLLNFFWQLICVSLAAQILTTPFSVYYFHQFPMYFLLANLIVVPVTNVLLIATIVLMVLSPVKFIAAIIGKVLQACIWWLNSVIEKLALLPLATWGSMHINLLQVVLLFTIIAAVGYWLMKKYKPGLYIALTAAILFFGSRSYSFWQAQHQQKIIVYNTSKFTGIDFINGRNAAAIMSKGLTNTNTFTYAIAPARVQYRLKMKETIPAFYRNQNAVLFSGKKILLVDAPLKPFTGADPIATDLLILSSNPRLYISDIAKQITPKKIIIDASVPAWKANYWKKDCDSLRIPYYDVAASGAFVMNVR